MKQAEHRLSCCTDMLNRKGWEPPSHARSSKYSVNIFVIKHLSTSVILGKSYLSNEDFWMPMDFWYPLKEINISWRNLFSSFLDWKIEDIDKIGGCGANLCFERRGGRAQENYPRMEGGMRDWDATSVRQGVIGGHEMATEINTGTQTSLDSTLILHAIGTTTVALLVFHGCRWHAVRPWWLRMSSAYIFLAMGRIQFSGTW